MVEDGKATEALRDELLEVFRGVAEYWASLPEFDSVTGRRNTIEDRCNGVVFSILVQLDGCGQLPSFDLVARIHPDDEDQGRSGVTISDTLHERYQRSEGRR